MDFPEFTALAMVCECLRLPNLSALPPRNADRDASAIHGRSGAQVALLQSPILPTAVSSYIKKRHFREPPLDKTHTRALRLNPLFSLFKCRLNPGHYKPLGAKEGVKKCQIILLNVPPFYGQMVVGRIFDLRVAAPPALTIYEWQRGANDLRVVVPSAVASWTARIVAT
jgi:hypothetical protein